MVVVREEEGGEGRKKKQHTGSFKDALLQYAFRNELDALALMLTQTFPEKWLHFDANVLVFRICGKGKCE